MTRRSAPLLAGATAAIAAIAVLALPSAQAEPAPVVIMGAGDIAECGPALADAEATGDLIRSADPDRVFTAGDNAYPDGSPTNYHDCYDPAWGSFRSKTLPTVGNHEYHTASAQGFKDYFGLDTWYAADLGNGWRYYALNSERSLYSGSEQLTWLTSDLDAHPGAHVVAAWHSPRYSNGPHGPDTDVCQLWEILAAHHADIVLVGHDHLYTRYPQMDCAGNATPDGIRQFVVGTGGNERYAVSGASSPQPDYTNGAHAGALRLELGVSSYRWAWVTTDAGTLDSGTSATHLLPAESPSPTPTETAAPTVAPTPATITTGQFERRVIARINDRRTHRLRPGSCPDTWAESWARHVVRTGDFRRGQVTDLATCGRVRSYDQVLAHGSVTPRAAVKAWMRSPQASRVLTREAYDRVGVAAIDTEQYGWVVVVDLIAR